MKAGISESQHRSVVPLNEGGCTLACTGHWQVHAFQDFTRTVVVLVSGVWWSTAYGDVWCMVEYSLMAYR